MWFTFFSKFKYLAMEFVTYMIHLYADAVKIDFHSALDDTVLCT